MSYPASAAIHGYAYTPRALASRTSTAATAINDVLVVADVVAHVVVGGFVDGREPDHVDTENLEVVPLLDDPAPVADAVAVAVLEAAGVALVGDAVFPPLLHGHCPSSGPGP
jgi:hypothetical protein